MNQIIANALVAGSIYSLVAIGFSFVWSTARFFHFAHGGIFSASAYTTYWATKLLRLPVVAGIVIGIFAGALLGVVAEAVVYRPLRRRHATPAVLLLSSLGLLIVIQNLISLLFGDQPLVLRTIGVSEGIGVLGARLTRFQLAIVLTNILLSATTELILRKTKIGTVMRAVANDPDLAISQGVNADRTIVFVFAAGSAMAAIGAILIGLDTDLTPTMGFNALLMGAAAAIIGGLGSNAGAVSGGFLVGFAQHLGSWKLPTEWQNTVVFIVVLAFLIVRPQGFFGKSLISTHT